MGEFCCENEIGRIMKKVMSPLKSWCAIALGGFWVVLDKDAGTYRVVPEETLQGELLSLARDNDAFRKFAADKANAELDRVTGQYLNEQSGEA